MSRILVLHGPNLNLLGKHNLKDNLSLIEISNNINDIERSIKVEIFSKQFNSESDIIDIIHQNTFNFIIGNLSSFQGTSVAIRDALLSVGVRFVEVKMDNLYFKNKIKDLDSHYSYFSDIAEKVFVGSDDKPYVEAVKYVLNEIDK